VVWPSGLDELPLLRDESEQDLLTRDENGKTAFSKLKWAAKTNSHISGL